MEQELLRFWIGQGAFALLFVLLLYYVLKQNKEREDRLMGFVERVIPFMEKVESKLCEIENRLDERTKS